MAGGVFSPDGKYMWTGDEWIPAPPNETNNEILSDDGKWKWVNEEWIEVKEHNRPSDQPENHSALLESERNQPKTSKIKLEQLKKDYYSFPDSADLWLILGFLFLCYLLFSADPLLSYADYLSVDCSNFANTFSLGGTEFYQGDAEYDKIKSDCNQVKLEAQFLLISVIGVFFFIDWRWIRSSRLKKYSTAVENFYLILEDILSKTDSSLKDTIILMVNRKKLYDSGPSFGYIVEFIDELFGFMSNENASRFANSGYFKTYERWLNRSKLKWAHFSSSECEEYFLLVKVIIKNYWMNSSITESNSGVPFSKSGKIISK